MNRLAMAALVSLAVVSPKVAAQQTGTGNDEEDVRALAAQLESLKASYAQEVRRLRELDMQVQAIQARVSGKTAQALPTPPPAVAQAAQDEPAPPAAATAPTGEGYASTAAEAQQAKEAARRSVDDVKQQQSWLASCACRGCRLDQRLCTKAIASSVPDGMDG